MRLKISENILNEIINSSDLSFSSGDEPEGTNEISVSKIKGKGAKQMTGTDFAQQAIQYHPQYSAGGGFSLREEEIKTAANTSIGSIDLLNTLNQDGLKNKTVNLVKDLNSLSGDQKSEIISIVLNYILENMIWDKIGQQEKEELKSKIT